MSRSCVASYVLAILALSTSACYWIYDVDRRPLKTQAASVKIKEFESALYLFRYDTGRFPTTAEGLDVLYRNPGRIQGWQKPYLSDKDVPLDPWGKAYFYRCPGQFGDFDLFSLGRDGLVGGEGEDADITSWH
jgi:general secretion pathway protein G